MRMSGVTQREGRKEGKIEERKEGKEGNEWGRKRGREERKKKEERKRTKEERRVILLVLWSLMLSIQMSAQVRHSLLLFTADWRHHLLPKV